MTICIGMLASDGIVIAADAEESDRYFKRSQQKIIPFVGAIPLGNNPNPASMACAFTGAGDAGYIDAFIAEAIRGISTAATQAEFQDYIAEKIRIFHEQHLFPLASAQEPPGIQILIGAYAGWHTGIFVSHGSTLRRGFPCAAVGAGAHFALSMISDVWRAQDVRHIEVLAAYIIAVTKDRIEGCGKHTAIVSLHNPIHEDIPGQPSRMLPPPQLLTHVPSKKIRKWEESFGIRWGPRQSNLLNEMIEEELADDAKQLDDKENT